jgi:hypothetical protein
LEFIPPVDSDGNYSIEGIEPFGPTSYHWSYEENIFTAMQGGSFRLPNGNTLITDCDSAHILEVTVAGEIVWSYTEDGANTVIARAQKYGLDYFVDTLLGDINEDGILNILDIVTLANCVLADNCAELENGCAGDLNGDGGYNVLDIVTLANLVLSG